MPIPPSPIKLKCRSCGWQRVFTQRSDVLVLPTACTKCGSEDLQRMATSPFDAAGGLVGSALDWIKNL